MLRAWRVRESLGALAQLGERLLCKHQVIGSIPIGSTRYVPDGGISGEDQPRRGCKAERPPELIARKPSSTDVLRPAFEGLTKNISR